MIDIFQKWLHSFTKIHWYSLIVQNIFQHTQINVDGLCEVECRICFCFFFLINQKLLVRIFQKLSRKFSQTTCLILVYFSNQDRLVNYEAFVLHSIGKKKKKNSKQLHL